MSKLLIFVEFFCNFSPLFAQNSTKIQQKQRPKLRKKVSWTEIKVLLAYTMMVCANALFCTCQEKESHCAVDDDKYVVFFLFYKSS